MQQTNDTPQPESIFDPTELLGSQMPFVDPFRPDFCEFQASSLVTRGLASPHAIMDNTYHYMYPFSAEPSQESLILSRIIIQGVPTALSRPEAHPDLAVESNQVNSRPGNPHLQSKED